MEVVICGQIPEHGLPLRKDVVPEEEVVRFLSLSVEEGVVVISLETLHHVSRMTRPLVDLTVCFHCIHEL